jgi:hypothetical protein
MSGDWSWLYLDARGEPIEGRGATATTFPTQGDAENYLGEAWRTLLEQGVESVTLREGGVTVYGPMSLRSAE